ncbi:MAG TPA: RHS repeat-associated core domain-containing protein [Cellvibrio sp.]|nr:RHS repeat-associated core domain-containing protein [Cellvibrio sp.]
MRTWGDEGIYYREIRYDLENNITYVKNSLGYVTTYYHNGVLPHRVVDPLNHASLTEYNEYSEIICETNELGYKTRYEFDEFGNTTKIIQPDNTSVQFIFDEKQNLIESIDQIGAQWLYKYDDNNRLTCKTNPLKHKTFYEYQNNFLSMVTDAGGNQFNFSYDQNLNLRTIAECNATQVSFEYDAMGNLLTTEDNRGNYRRYVYDKLTRVRSIEEPDGNQRIFFYDGAGNIVRAKDEHQDIFLEYSGMGRLVARTQAGTTVKFEYDREEQLTAIINEHNRIYQFELNPRGEIIRESGFDKIIREFIKDAAGRTIRVNRANQRFSIYSYDVNSRINRVVHSDGSSKTYEYRADGELIKATNDSIELKWELDILGRQIKEYQGKFWVSSEYNSLNDRIRVQSSFGLDQKIERNRRGDVLKVSVAEHFEAIFGRDNQGLEVQRSLPGGIHSHWTRDKLGRPLSHEITHGKGVINRKTYLWGLNRRLLKLIDGLKRETTYQHDAVGNLLSARYCNQDFDLRVPDAVGNLFKTHAQNDREYGPAGQLLAIHSSKGTTHYCYDAEGNLISKLEPGNKLWRYQWSCNGMMEKVFRPDGKEVTFEYDPLGRRICKTFDKKITRWVWDGNNPLHEWNEYNLETLTTHKLTLQHGVAESILAERPNQLLQPITPQAPPSFAEGSLEAPITWLFEPDTFAPIAKLVGSEHYSIITDHIGTPNFVFDKNGQQVWSSDIDVWGNLRKVNGEKAFCPFRFQGQYEDNEIGLYYNRFRYYDPTAGQYLSQDPIRLAGGMTPYSYTSNPTYLIDPLGLSATGTGGCGTGGTRDSNGVMRTNDGRFAIDETVVRTELQRPSLRSQTKKDIQASAPKNSTGKFVDQNGNVINEIHYGHIAGHENRRILAAADQLGLTQAQLNDYVNARPQFFKIEEAKKNLSHADELPGRDNFDHIVIDMEDFFDM